MGQTDVEIEQSVFTQVEEALSEEIECEPAGHKEGMDTHDGGSAKWYIQMRCTDCGHTTPVIAVCQWWKDSCVLQNGNLWCPQCRDLDKSCDFLVLEQIVNK